MLNNPPGTIFFIVFSFVLSNLSFSVLLISHAISNGKTGAATTTPF